MLRIYTSVLGGLLTPRHPGQGLKCPEVRALVAMESLLIHMHVLHSSWYGSDCKTCCTV